MKTNVWTEFGILYLVIKNSSKGGNVPWLISFGSYGGIGDLKSNFVSFSYKFRELNKHQIIQCTQINSIKKTLKFQQQTNDASAKFY